jgi:hypothetical protein
MKCVLAPNLLVAEVARLQTMANEAEFLRIQLPMCAGQKAGMMQSPPLSIKRVCCATPLRIELVVCRLSSIGVLFAVAALISGCGESDEVEQQSNLRAIAAYYSQFLAHHRGQLPANEEEFKKFIQAKGGEALAYKGLSVDELFVSSRDGKPFVVRYRGDKSWPARDLVAYEQEGRDGTRHGATSIGGYAVISDEEFRDGRTVPAAAR